LSMFPNNLQWYFYFNKLLDFDPSLKDGYIFCFIFLLIILIFIFVFFNYILVPKKSDSELTRFDTLNINNQEYYNIINQNKHITKKSDAESTQIKVSYSRF